MRGEGVAFRWQGPASGGQREASSGKPQRQPSPISVSVSQHTRRESSVVRGTRDPDTADSSARRPLARAGRASTMPISQASKEAG